MTQASIDILEKHKHHWHTLRDAGYLRGLNQHEKEDLTRVARIEFFGERYSPDWWCPECCAEAVRSIYTQYEKQIA